MQFNYYLILEFDNKKIVYFHLYSVNEEIIYHGYNIIKNANFKSKTFLDDLNKKKNKNVTIIPIDYDKFNYLSNLSFKEHICNFNKKELFQKLNLEEYSI
jgi:uncharacterized Zn-finger protein